MTKEEKNQTNKEKMETKEEKIQTSEEKKYFAFISYSHKDKAAAKKLHDFMEGYKLPANLNGKEDLPKRIRPIFRDEAELKGGELTPQIQEALRNSRYLIVVCSPRSAQSYYVNEEIKYFQSLGRETKILPYIIDGKATTDEDPDCCYTPCFKELQKKYELLGGDVRDLGYKAAALKIIAPMLGIEFPALYNRFAKKEKEKRNIVITAITAFALLATLVALYILNQNNQLEKAYADLKNEKAKVVSEKKAKDKAYAELDLTYKDLFATKDTLAIKNLALQSTNRELNLKNLSLQESKSIILAENAMSKIEKGDYFGARRTALEAISLSYSPEAERALRQSWENNSGTLEGHSNIVKSVCWSPDGKYLASGSEDYTVKIWDAKSGECIQTLEGHSDYVCSVCWSPDGKYLASGSRDKTIKIWDAKSGKELKTLEGHSELVYSVCWSPDGNYLASGSNDYTLKIWDAKSGEYIRILEGHSENVWSVSWSPDGKYLASGSLDKTVKIWDANSGKELKTLEEHSSDVTSVCWSPDGKYLASNSGFDAIIIWDANSGKKLKTLKKESWYKNCVSWSPDGKYLASSSNGGEIDVWDVNREKFVLTFDGQMGMSESVMWSPNGKYLVAGYISGNIIIWNFEKETEYLTLDSIPKKIIVHDDSPNGKYYCSYYRSSEIQIISNKNHFDIYKTLEEHYGGIFSHSWTNDGNYIVAGCYDGTVKIWDVNSGKAIKSFEGHNTSVNFVGFTSDGRKIISKDDDGKILQWDFPPLDELIEKTKKWAGKK